jgi:hypothetical protein
MASNRKPSRKYRPGAVLHWAEPAGPGSEVALLVARLRTDKLQAKALAAIRNDRGTLLRTAGSFAEAQRIAAEYAAPVAVGG